MDWQGWFSLSVIGIAMVALAIGRLAPHRVLVSVLFVFVITGLLSVDEALLGFTNDGVLTIAALFIVAAGIDRSGGIALVVNHLLGKPSTTRAALVRIFPPVLVLSGFLNNTPVVAAMIPAIRAWSAQISVPLSKLMIPLSYTAILGGSLTIIGTSTKLVVNDKYQLLTGEAGFSMFSVTGVGLPVALIGIAFIWCFLPRWLPDSTLNLNQASNLTNRLNHEGLLLNKLGIPSSTRMKRLQGKQTQAYFSWVILAFVVLTAATGLLSLLLSSIIGALLMLVSGCLRLRQVPLAFDWKVIITIGSSFALGTALINTGVASQVSTHLMQLSHGEAWLLLVLTYFTVSLLTEFINNIAAALLMLPIALELTLDAGLSSEPFVLAIMMAASASFATPLGYQTNMMVYGPGGYLFRDFLRVGIPMNLVTGCVTISMLLLFWPLS